MSTGHTTRGPRRLGAATAASVLGAGAAFVAVTAVAVPAAHATTTCVPQVTTVPFGFTGRSVTISPNVRNKGQVVSCSPFSLASGQAGTITVTVTGTVAKGSACGAQLPLAGVWGAGGEDPTGTKLTGSATTIPKITVTC